jgi:hypothetical protein
MEIQQQDYADAKQKWRDLPNIDENQKTLKPQLMPP